MNRWLAVLAAVAATVPALDAFAQGGRGREERNRRIDWSDSLDDGASKLSNNRRFLFVYIRPEAEASDPTEFRNNDIVDASRDSFSFVKVPFNKDDAQIKEWKVAGAPTLLGCDKFGNEVCRMSSCSIDAIRAVIKNTPDGVAKLEATMKSMANKIEEAEKTGDRARIVKACMALIQSGKKGYAEIGKAAEKLDALAADEFKKVELAESVDESTAIQHLEGIVRDFAGSPPAAEAEIQIAERENKAGNVAAALARLQKVAKLTAPVFKLKAESAQKWIELISSEGLAKVEAAQQMSGAEKDKARDALKRVQKDYAGTDAARKAAEALKSMEQK